MNTCDSVVVRVDVFLLQRHKTTMLSLQLLRKWLASAGADFYERGIQALVHRWQSA
jgi:hypothetical protein